MLKRPALKILLATAAVGLSSAALAYCDDNNYYSPGPIPVATPPAYAAADAGFIIGLQGGYGNTHWDNIDNNISSTGFAGRGYLGYQFNPFFGIESGFTYLPKATDDINGVDFDVTNYAIDLLGKLSWPVTPGFSLYAKAGVAYLNSNVSTNLIGVDSTSRSHVGPAYGVGAQYEIIPNLALSVDWMRFSGDGDVTDFNNYQPQQDAAFVGLSYKFPTHYS
ncbi:MAG: outer membrane beta-barrel protein [Gammaproteobacteria bacterium]